MLKDKELEMEEEHKAGNALAGRVGRLENDVSGIKADVNHILITLDKVADRVNAPAPGVNWGWVTTGVAVLLSLIGTLIAPLYQEQGRNEEAHIVYEQQVLDQAKATARLEGYLEAVKDGVIRQSD